MKTILRKIAQKIRKLFSFLPQQKIILFDSFYGERYSDNPKALYLYAKEHFTNYRLIWIIDRHCEQKFQSYGVPYVVKNTIKALYLESVAKLWVTNTALPQEKKPNNKQYVLQTWHGTPLKRIGFDQVDFQNGDRNAVIEDTNKWSYLITPNQYSHNIFVKTFPMDNLTLIDSGYPRNDFLYKYNDENVINTKKRFCIYDSSSYIILYVPTWRDDELGTSQQATLHLDLKSLHVAFPDAIFLVRLHYLIRQAVDLSQFSDFVIDVSDYEDISELYIISDMLITDYSSAFFDYANLRRPMVFFAYDLDYYQTTRGLYFDYQKVPGPVVKNNKELIQAINYLRKHFIIDDKYQYFIETYCNWENGHSSQRVWDFVMKKLNGS